MQNSHGRHLECFNELLKGSPTHLGGPVTWNQEVLDKCFEKGAYCDNKVEKRDGAPAAASYVETRGLSYHHQSKHFVAYGCEGWTKPYYDTNAKKCDLEMRKGTLDPKIMLTFNDDDRWDQKLMGKCFKDAICRWPAVKRDAVLESNEGVVLGRDVKPNKEYIMTISGMGKCSLHYRRFYFENMVKGGKNDKKCNKELKKGLAKWNQGLIDKCFYISDCWNQKRDVEPVFQTESSPTDKLDTLGNECQAVRIQLYACTDSDPSQCFANVWCCGDACEGPDVVGPATAIPDAPPSVKRTTALAASGLQGLPTAGYDPMHP
ncbi:MAG: hypothetical protein Q9177_004547 [Variospora cf. flavescens]